MNATLKIGGASVFLTALFSSTLYLSIQNSLTEFFSRNPGCVRDDTDSAMSLLKSSFKKSESFRLVLLAMCGAFFLSRLAFELGRILLTESEKQREKREEKENSDAPVVPTPTKMNAKEKMEASLAK